MNPDEDEGDANMDLEEFVTKFTLPHVAKVKEGVYDAYAQNSTDISNGELLEIYRVMYPMEVTLEFLHSTSDAAKQRVKTSTVNDELKFHILSRNEKPAVYRTIADVVRLWPLMVRCEMDDANESVAVVDGVALHRPSFRRNDELRPVRKIWVGRNLLLECKEERTKQLIRLPATDAGRFLELTDPKSYTLQELIDIAVVDRRLKIDRSGKSISFRGVPRDYSGTLLLSKPEVNVQASRLQQDEYSLEVTVSDPFLVPIDCGIVLSPRDETYQQKPSIYKTYSLSSLIGLPSLTYPSVARVVSWTEQSCVLQNHLIRPGDYLVFHARRSVNWILANGRHSFFLIPSTNRGTFLCNPGKSPLKLDFLETQQFPINVLYFNDPDDSALEGESLSLDAFIKDEPCVLASKIFGDRVGIAFHLPLRTKIRVQPAEWRGERLSRDPPTKFSTYDDSVEEIPIGLYEEILERGLTEYLTTTEDLAPGLSTEGLAPGLSQASPARAPSDQTHTDSLSQGSTLVRKESSEQEESVVIPENGNITTFSASQMSQFLKLVNAPDEVIVAWLEKRITGRDFARMSDDTLRDYGIDNAVIKFFRNGSKVGQSCLDRL